MGLRQIDLGKSIVRCSPPPGTNRFEGVDLASESREDEPDAATCRYFSGSAESLKRADTIAKRWKTAHHSCSSAKIRQQPGRISIIVPHAHDIIRIGIAEDRDRAAPRLAARTS